MSEVCLAQVILHSQQILVNSGHAIFQKGQYYDCLQAPGFHYNLVLFNINGTNSGIFSGLCLPAECTPQIISEQMDGVFTFLELPYRVGAIMDHIQDYQYPFSWVSYLTIIILTACIGLTLFATITRSKQRLLKGIALQESLKIFKTKESDLNILNGVRALAMMWVVFGHYYFNSVTNIQNTLSIGEIFKKPFLLLVQTGLTAVDIFFFLGGFFLAFVFVREKSKSIIKYPLAILQRVLRIWPSYILAMMIYYSFYMQMGEGPLWSSQESIVQFCSHMWRDVLFINNFVDNGKQMCLNWGWYLQVDFQIFIVCIILLFLYGKISHKASYITGVVMAVGSITYNITYTQVHNQKLFTNVQALMSFTNYLLDVYIKPYARWTPYFMGLYLGLFYYDYQKAGKNQDGWSRPVKGMFMLKEKFERSKGLRIAVEWSGIALMMFLVFILRPLQVGYYWPQILHSLYGCLEKPFFIFGLLMVTFPTILGVQGSLFRTLLDNKILNFLAKISFCTYLIHLMVILQYISSRSFDNYYSLLATFTPYLGCLVVSCFFGFLMTIFVELPFSVWQKEVMKGLINIASKNEGTYAKSQELIGGRMNQTIQNESELRSMK